MKDLAGRQILVLMVVAGSISAQAQQYVISTYAGGGPLRYRPAALPLQRGARVPPPTAY